MGFSGLPGGLLIYQGRLFAQKGHLWSERFSYFRLVGPCCATHFCAGISLVHRLIREAFRAKRVRSNWRACHE